MASAATPAAADFTRAAAIDGVSISRDGEHIAALTSPDGITINLSIWDVRDVSKAPVVLGMTHMRPLGVRFIKNDRLLVTAIQTFTAGPRRGHLIKQWLTDLKGQHWDPLLADQTVGSEDARWVNAQVDAEVISDLPLDPDNVLAVDHRLGGDGDVYRINVHTGAATRVERASEHVVALHPDLKGELREREVLNYQDGKVFIAVEFRNPDTGRWEEHFREFAKDRQTLDFLSFSTDPNVVYLKLGKDRDKAGIYEYDIRARKIIEPAFEHKMFEADSIVLSRNAADFGAPLGFVYSAETSKVYWTDESLGAAARGVAAALGVKSTPIQWTDPGGAGTARIAVADGAAANIVSVSGDRTMMIVEKSGPKQPPEFYLYTAGKLSLLGKSRPWIDTAALGDTRMVEYPARDGLMIPAFLTTPPAAQFGPGPYPTLIEPHGGPWARDEMEWDVGGWTQYFASRGYAVLQPQFRGSEGWGQKLWRAGDGEWGQKMQDDKDDGVKWLVAQKIADPARVAMFGYSYGGYAALAAAIRPNGLYQCAISGAGAGDLASIERATFDNRFQREFQHPTIGGLDALEHAKEAKIPVFLYHGDRDQTVDIAQSRKFAAALKAAGKPYRLLEIPDMGHQYITMTPAMMQTQLTEIEGFLKTGCKSGGL